MSFLMLLGLNANLKPEDWPGWRGPTRQGISGEKGIPLHWSPTENIAWKTKIPGLGWSSPIVYGERVFVTSATEEGSRAGSFVLTGQLERLFGRKKYTGRLL
jgi:hypothetical protein